MRRRPQHSPHTAGGRRALDRLGPNLTFWRFCVRQSRWNRQVPADTPLGYRWERHTDQRTYGLMVQRYVKVYPYLAGWI